MSNSTMSKFVSGLANALYPLNDILDSQENFTNFLREIGWNATTMPSAYVSIKNSVLSIINTYENLSDTPSESDILSLIIDIGDLYSALQALSGNSANAPGGTDSSVFLSEFPSRLFEWLIVKYLKQEQPKIYSLFEVFGVIRIQYNDATSQRPAYTRLILDYAKIADIISNPLNSIKTTIDWGVTSTPLSGLLTDILFNSLVSADIKAIKRNATEEDVLRTQVVFQNDDSITHLVEIYLLALNIAGTYQSINLQILDSVGSTALDTGYILNLVLPQSLSINQPISDSLSLQLNASLLAGKMLSFLVKPTGVNFNLNQPGSSTPIDGISVKLVYEPDSPFVILGNASGTRLELRQAGIMLGVDYRNNFEIVSEADLSGLALVLNPGESDNFIKKIFGEGTKEIVFPLIIRWSSETGISFKGSGSFEYSVPAHFKLGPLEFNDVVVALKAPSGQNKITTNIGTSITGVLGPLTFTVNNIGLKLQLDLAGGNAGPIGFNVGLKPPTGIGFSIDADPVSGGGFLNFDESTSTYTGGLELNFSKISLKAIGILTTKMPDGGDGFSLLIIITAEFTPIQLGMGFTLNGVGGLLGWNRTMNTDRLRTGIKDNTLDSILFPQDIVKNANVIISNIGQAFPVKRDRFIIGPMAKLGWGTPTLITIEIGVLIEVPTPVVIAIVGVIKALLPSDNNRIIAIQVNFLGVIDFGKKYLSFDASLFDSKILFFSLYGDMALRVYWGDKPNFLLSVGGFHPKFTPPPMNLPQMQRLAIELANSNNLKIRIETYFAVTSNSAQFGARLEARAKAWKIEAIGALWFDILFQFSPFYFNANMGAMFAIKMGSRELLSVHVELSLEGPNPWRAQGRASFKVLGVRVNVSFDKTFGQVRVEPVEMAELWGKFNDAILNKDSWEVIGPDRSHQTVAFREVPDGNTDLVIDPFGALRFNQKLVPMNISLSKYGTAKIKDVNKFQVTSLVLTDADNNTQTITPTITQDYFARNEFFYMTDDEKLSKESYERFDSGFSIGSTDEIYVSAYTNRVCAYEDITIDTRPDWRFRLVAANAIDMDTAMFDRHVSNNYISEAKLSNSSAMVIADGPRSTEVLKEEYFVMNRNTMQKVQGYNLEDKYDNVAAADIALGAARNGWPADAANFIVVNSFELQTI